MRLYLDLDGVFADFDGHFLKYFNLENKNRISDDKLWEMIDSYPTFFQDLPLMDDAHKLFETCNILFGYRNISFLTACPKHNYTQAAIQKRQWVYQHFGRDYPVLPVLGGKNKALFMHEPGDILIDDFKKNISAWVKLGGMGILHTNVKNTEEKLSIILNENLDK